MTVPITVFQQVGGSMLLCTYKVCCFQAFNVFNKQMKWPHIGMMYKGKETRLQQSHNFHSKSLHFIWSHTSAFLVTYEWLLQYS